MEYKTVQTIDTGDQFIFIGQIIDINKQQKEPMLMLDWFHPAGWHNSDNLRVADS